MDLSALDVLLDKQIGVTEHNAHALSEHVMLPPPPVVVQFWSL